MAYSVENREIVSASKAINRTIDLISELFADIFGIQPSFSGNPTERRDQMLNYLKKHIINSAQWHILRDRLGVPLTENSDAMIESVGKLIDNVTKIEKRFILEVDDLTPNEVKDAAYRVINTYEQGIVETDVSLADFLRAILDEACAPHILPRRLNVGENRHFPRLFQFIRELALENTFEDGQGLRILNAGGGGRVALNPTNPRTLNVRLNFEYFRET